MTVDPATVRAAMTPVVQAAVLDAFKLGVGHAIRAIDAALQPGNSLAIPVEGTYASVTFITETASITCRRRSRSGYAGRPWSGG